MAFLPTGAEPPRTLETDRFRVRPMTIHDVVKDYDAVMTSRDQLWEMFGTAWGWPAADLSLEQDLIDLAWHQKEFQLGRAFAYVVMAPDERRLLGCVYVDPPARQGFDAEVCYWVRASEQATGLDAELGAVVRRWLVERWPQRWCWYTDARIGPAGWPACDERGPRGFRGHRRNCRTGMP